MSHGHYKKGAPAGERPQTQQRLLAYANIAMGWGCNAKEQTKKH